MLRSSLGSPHPDRGETHPEVPLQVHGNGRVRQIIERREFAGHPPQFVAWH